MTFHAKILLYCVRTQTECVRTQLANIFVICYPSKSFYYHFL